MLGTLVLLGWLLGAIWVVYEVFTAPEINECNKDYNKR